MAAIATASRTRRTQEERSAETRAKLLDATIDCLFERGWSGTTTTEVADRAGVSRGAQLHHFPTRADLVATAVEHLFTRRLEEFREAFAKLPDGADRNAATVDILWSMISGPTFYAWLELVVAARTDPALGKTVSAISRRFQEQVDRTFRDLFPVPGSPNPFFEVVPLFVFGLLEGLALGRIVYDGSEDDRRRGRVLEMLKSLSALVMRKAPEDPASPDTPVKEIR